ncbi:MAG: MazG nucleotide pyrophosphohydrolase domain-containing protein [Candidatus Altiarchaeota archaeon]|nr:MazG nucleotide pyrophosphohydrolase domain-containing protein [Candidatus Altiarchaeota archaeon]
MSSLSEMQEQVGEYDKKHGWSKDQASHIVLHMTEELGEIARRILRRDGYKKEVFSRKELGEELTDILYLNLKLANTFHIELEEEWNLMWERYRKKTNRY